MTALIDLYKGVAGDHAALVRMLTKEFGLHSGEGSGQFLNPHRMRREVIAQRLRLYRGDARVDFERMIELVFETESVQHQRKKLIAVACEKNVTSGIVNEVASLYDQPAMRLFKDDDAMTERFRARAEELELDEVMQEQQRLTFLCNETLLWSVSSEEGAKPELHIVTPDAFDAIPHPTNKLHAAGFIIDAAPPFIPEWADRSQLKFYEIWDDTYTYHLNARGEMIGSPIAHELGRIPGALLHRRKPVDRLLDSRAGSDITAAHLGVALLAIMSVRLAKSQGERQPILRGNLANVAAGQPMDGERPIALPPDVIAEMLDSKTSNEHYLALKEDKINDIEDTYGIPHKPDGATDTGKVFITRRLKLNGIRNEQRRRARVNERLVVKLIGFDPAALRVDHAEQMVPADAAEEIALLKEKLRLGLDSVVAYLMRKDPDLTRADAVMLIKSNVRDWAMLITELRVLNAPADADAENPGRSPQENGGMSGDDEEEDDGANDGSGTPIAEFAKSDDRASA